MTTMVYVCNSKECIQACLGQTNGTSFGYIRHKLDNYNIGNNLEGKKRFLIMQELFSISHATFSFQPYCL